MSYVNGSMAWYDLCDRGNWWMNIVQHISWDMSFDVSRKVMAYWCLPRFEMTMQWLGENQIF